MLVNSFKTTLYLTFVFGLGVIDKLDGASPVVRRRISNVGWKFFEETQHWYKSHNDVQSWVLANITCINERGYLAIINSEAEKNFLLGLTPNHIISLKAIPHVFAIGFYFDTASAIYKTVDGQNLQQATYIEWTKGFPKSENIDNEGNSFGFMNTKKGGTLENWDGSYSQPFICETQTNPLLLRAIL